MSLITRIFPVWALTCVALFVLVLVWVYLVNSDTTMFDNQEFMNFIYPMLGVFMGGILLIGAVSQAVRRKQAEATGMEAVSAMEKPHRKMTWRYLIVPMLSIAPTLAIQSYMHPPTYSETSSWQAQLDMAKWAAHFVDDKAVPIILSAQPICCRKPAVTGDSTLELTFDFVRPGGEHFTVKIADTSPPRILGVETKYQRVDKTQEQLDHLAQRFDTISFSPRDAVRILFSDRNLHKVKADKVGPRISFDLLEESYTNEPATYFIGYNSKPEPGSDDDYIMAVIELDPETGEIQTQRVLTFD